MSDVPVKAQQDMLNRAAHGDGPVSACDPFMLSVAERLESQGFVRRDPWDEATFYITPAGNQHYGRRAVAAYHEALEAGDEPADEAPHHQRTG
jgi:hypothetical protein